MRIPPRTIRYWWEDFPAGSVREFGAKPVTRDAVIAFAAEFDPQPFHLDDDAALPDAVHRHRRP